MEGMRCMTSTPEENRMDGMRSGSVYAAWERKVLRVSRSTTSSSLPMRQQMDVLVRMACGKEVSRERIIRTGLRASCDEGHSLSRTESSSHLPSRITGIYEGEEIRNRIQSGYK